MKQIRGQLSPLTAPLSLLGGALMLLSPPVAFSMDPCEELRRDCMDYCRYQNPMLDHRDCKGECRDRVRNCRGGGRGMMPGMGPMGYPGGQERSEKREPDFTGMPSVGQYRDYGAPGYGAPGYGAPGYGAAPAGRGYGYPGGQYPQPGYQPPAAAAPRPGATPPAAPAQPAAPQGSAAPERPASAPQLPAAPTAPQYGGYGYPPGAPYGGYPGAPYGGYPGAPHGYVPYQGPR